MIEEEVHVDVEVEVAEGILNGLYSLLIHLYSLISIRGVIRQSDIGVMDGSGLLDCWCRIENIFIDFDLLVGIRDDLDGVIFVVRDILFFFFFEFSYFWGFGYGLMFLEGFSEF